MQVMLKIFITRRSSGLCKKAVKYINQLKATANLVAAQPLVGKVWLLQSRQRLENNCNQPGWGNTGGILPYHGTGILKQ